MKFPKHYGKCRICGKETVLTYEHVPPQKAFNSNTVVEYSYRQIIDIITDRQRMPWDYSGIRGKYNQKGGGGYYLCKECNNNTGSWYMEEYTIFVNTLGYLIQKEKFKVNESYDFTLFDLSPLKIFKGIITLMCDTNNNCLGDERLRSFLLDKESNDFDTEKYQVYAYLVTPNSNRITGLVAEAQLNTSNIICFSEVVHYPIGFTMYIDKPYNFKPFGFDVTSLVNHKYDDKCNLFFSCVPYIQLSSLLPRDYRTKDELLKCINLSNNKDYE